MASTNVPTYQRTNIPQLNSSTIGQVESNFNESWNFEHGKQPDLQAIRLGYPTQVKNDMNLGGQLRADTQDATVGAALNQAANAGVVDSYAGRGLVAKDIGSTAETLRHSRMDRAGQYISGEPLEYLGLTSGQIGSVYVDDKVREFQNQKDKAQAAQADQASNIATALGVAQMLGGII